MAFGSYEIPENYDVRKILEALISELVKQDTLDWSSINLIIEKGNPANKE